MAKKTGSRRVRSSVKGSHVPRFRAMLAVSLDGYIADAHGGAEWLDDAFSPEIDFDAFMRTIGVTVYGRTTYEWAVAHGGFTGGGRNIVLTHRPIEHPPRSVEPFRSDVRELAAQLRRDPGGHGQGCLADRGRRVDRLVPRGGAG